MTIDVTKKGGAKLIPSRNAPSTGFTADALLEVQKSDMTVNSNTGVSTKNAHDSIKSEKPTKLVLEKKQWYALRTTYGREKKAYNYIVANDGIAYYPTISIDKLVDGRVKNLEVSRIPNILFAYGTEKEIQRFVYDNVHLPFLRFYYRHYHKGNHIVKEPLVVPERQMETLKIICEAENEDTIITQTSIQKFQKGQLVQVMSGPFKGVIGRVARFSGQQRVGIVIDDMVTAITAYVPSGMMKETT